MPILFFEGKFATFDQVVVDEDGKIQAWIGLTQYESMIVLQKPLEDTITTLQGCSYAEDYHVPLPKK